MCYLSIDKAIDAGTNVCGLESVWRVFLEEGTTVPIFTSLTTQLQSPLTSPSNEENSSDIQRLSATWKMFSDLDDENRYFQNIGSHVIRHSIYKVALGFGFN